MSHWIAIVCVVFGVASAVLGLAAVLGLVALRPRDGPPTQEKAWSGPTAVLLASAWVFFALAAGLVIADRAFAGATGFQTGTTWSNETQEDNFKANPAVEIRYVNVGQGDGVVIRVGKTIVVSDAGQNNPEAVDAALHTLGAKQIDVAILSHPHRDHVKNFSDLVDTFGWTIKMAVLSRSDYWQETTVNKQLLADLTKHGAQLVYVNAGDHFNWGGASWEILSPPKGKYTGPYQAADSSVVYVLRAGSTEALFTGDIGPAVAKQVASRWVTEGLGRAAIFLATHHGSAQGSIPKLLAAIKPEWAVLSTGKNSYGHPTASAIKRLEGSGASIWCTNANGTIIADFNGTKAIAWHAEKQAAPWWNALTKKETGKCVGH
jgi:beta-lactamase superfamily II metal-dependent hydrolase